MPPVSTNTEQRTPAPTRPQPRICSASLTTNINYHSPAHLLPPTPRPLQSLRSPSAMRRVARSLLSLCVLLLVIASTSAQQDGTLQPSALYDFESPELVSYPLYVYNPPIDDNSQPWSWTSNQGGVAAEGGPFDPPGSDTPPHGTQVGTLALTCTVVNPQRCHAATAQTALSPLVLRSSPHVCSRPALLCSLCSALLCSALLCSALPMCRVCSRCSTRSFRCHPATVCSRMCRR